MIFGAESLPGTTWFDNGVLIAVITFVGFAIAYIGRMIIPATRDWIQSRIKADEATSTVLTKMEEHQRRSIELQSKQEERCQAHVTALEENKSALQHQTEVLVQIRDGTADMQAWHSDPSNPRNVGAVHESIGDLAQSIKDIFNGHPEFSAQQRREINERLDRIVARVDLMSQTKGVS